MRWTPQHPVQAVMRAILLGALALVPLTTLVHRNDVGRWDVQRSAMAAPDEFSYLLMARHFLQGGGLSLQSEIGRDTFYPPGYPLLLAAWWKCVGISAFAAHALNALLLGAAVVAVYFLCRRLLRELSASDHRRFALSENTAGNLALVIAGIFACNWHVLETSLLVMSEPAFMLVTFAWLILALRWPDWPAHLGQTAVLALLAVAAWSIRGAGIVCVATTVLYQLWFVLGRGRAGAARLVRLATWALVLAVPEYYQLLLAILAPEKSLFSGEDSANSYPRQLLHGLMIHPDPKLPHTVWNLTGQWLDAFYILIFGHVQDLAESFVPWLRENPDYHFRDIVGKIFAFLALAGFTFGILRLWPRRQERDDAPSVRKATDPGRLPGQAPWVFVMLYLLLYIALYLLWPFNMPRFWSPVLPPMLVLAAVTVMTFGTWRLKIMAGGVFPAMVMLALLLALSAIEDYVQLGNYARRLNYVSDALAGGVARIMRQSPDGRHTVIAGMGDDELYILAWYFSQARGGAEYRIVVPEPHVKRKGNAAEHADEMLLRCVGAAAAQSPAAPPGEHFFLFSYFPGIDTRDTMESFLRRAPSYSFMKTYQKEIIVTVWEIHEK